VETLIGTLPSPDQIDEGKVVSIKPVHVFDVTQTQVLARHAHAA
jgi:hypothetical protein